MTICGKLYRRTKKPLFKLCYNPAKTEVIYNAREDHYGMHRVQAEKLQHNEEQEERPRSSRDEQVLQILP